MNIIKKTGSGLLGFSKKIVQYDMHKENMSWIRSMVQSTFVPSQKRTSAELKALTKLPPSAKRYALATKGLDRSEQRKIWKNHVLISYTLWFFLLLNIIYTVEQFSFIHLVSATGIGIIFMAMAIKHSLGAWQINNKKLDGASAFLKDFGSFFPDPHFND